MPNTLIRLSIAGTALEIYEGELKSCSPTPIDQPTFGHTLIGVATARGRRYLPLYQFDLEAIASYDKWLLLHAIAIVSEELRASGQDPSILMDGQYLEYSEPTPRTRALAPGASERSLGNGLIAYRAQYNVGVVDLSPPDLLSGRTARINCKLMELNRRV